MPYEASEKTKPKSHSFVSAIIVTLLLLIGLSLLLYPTAADYINSLNYRQDIENYQRELFELDDSERQAMLEAAHSYNTALLDRSSRIGELDAAQRRAYESLLDPSGTGTHAILSGHTGLPSSKLFSNIDQLKIGDTFTMHILKETLTYKVESIERVAPDELKNLRIEQGQELCTLMTCTPYGINTNRLVVTGRRIETQAEPSQESTPVAAECISSSFSDFMIRFRIENILLLHADESSMKEYAKKFVEERYPSTETIKEILDCVRDNCL